MDSKRSALHNVNTSTLCRLQRGWFARDALILSRALLGCYLVHDGVDLDGVKAPPRIARIVETEAYRGPKDLACHARAGVTSRTRTLYGQEGHAYVFLIYGMHDCFNVTCLGAGISGFVGGMMVTPAVTFGRLLGSTLPLGAA